MNQKNLFGDRATAPVKPDRAACRREGQRRKAAAHQLLEDHRAGVVRNARRAMTKLVLENGSCTMDDVRDRIEVPEGINPKCLGAVPSTLARQQIIERDGFVTTRRPKAHARPVSLWRLRDAAKAKLWLARHPPWELDAPPQEQSPAAATAEPCASDPPRPIERRHER